ncbi:MAG: hypothetical protein GYA36_17385 [Veillonellaceae bacterium]|nr:hypothetical protein [Veillonellaceae bacterium]
MSHPVSSIYLDEQVARALTSLPAAGAWDSAPPVLYCDPFVSMLLFCKYKRGGTGGACTIKVEMAVHTGSDWYQTTAYKCGAVTAGSDVTSNVQRETYTYQATSAADEQFILGPIQLGGGVNHVRVVAKESGATSTPGTLEIFARFA